MFRIKPTIFILLFLLFTGIGFSCNEAEYYYSTTYCANSTHTAENTSCYSLAGVFNNTMYIDEFSCYYGCDNRTGACIEPYGTLEYLWIIEVAFLALLAVLIIIFLMPLPPGFENLKLAALMVIFLVVFLLFFVINIYASQFTGHLIGTMGGWVEPIMLFFWPIIYMLIGLFAMYTLWALFVKKPKDEEDW